MRPPTSRPRSPCSWRDVQRRDEPRHDAGLFPQPPRDSSAPTSGSSCAASARVRTVSRGRVRRPPCPPLLHTANAPDNSLIFLIVGAAPTHARPVHQSGPRGDAAPPRCSSPRRPPRSRRRIRRAPPPPSHPRRAGAAPRRAVRLGTAASEGIGLARAARSGRAGSSTRRGPRTSRRSPRASTTRRRCRTISRAISNPDRGGNGGGCGDSPRRQPPPASSRRRTPRRSASPRSSPLFTADARRRGARARSGREAAEIGVTSTEAQLVFDVTQRTTTRFSPTTCHHRGIVAGAVGAACGRSSSRRTWARPRSSSWCARASPVTTSGRAGCRAAPNRYPRLPAAAPAARPAVRRAARPHRRPQGSAVIARAEEAPVTTVNVSAADVLAVDPAIAARTREFVATTDTSSRTRAPVRQALKNVEIAREQLRATRAQRLPSIGVSTNYQRLAYPGDGLPRSFAEFFPNWTAAVAGASRSSRRRVRVEELAAEAPSRRRSRRSSSRRRARRSTAPGIAELEQAGSGMAGERGHRGAGHSRLRNRRVRSREGISTGLELSETRVPLQQRSPTAPAPRATSRRPRPRATASNLRSRRQQSPISPPAATPPAAPLPAAANRATQTGSPPTGITP